MVNDGGAFAEGFDVTQFKLELDITEGQRQLEKFASSGAGAMKNLEDQIEKSEKLFKNLGKIGVESIEDINKEIRKIEELQRLLSQAVERIEKNKKTQTFAFVKPIEGDISRKVTQQGAKAEFHELEKKLELLRETKRLLGDEAQHISVVSQNASKANELFSKGLEKQPEKIGQVRDAVHALTQEIERLEQLGKRTARQDEFLKELKNLNKIELADIHNLNKLEERNLELIQQRSKAQEELAKKQKAANDQIAKNRASVQQFQVHIEADRQGRLFDRETTRAILKTTPGLRPDINDPLNKDYFERRRREASAVFSDPLFDIRNRVKQNIEANRLAYPTLGLQEFLRQTSDKNPKQLIQEAERLRKEFTSINKLVQEFVKEKSQANKTGVVDKDELVKLQTLVNLLNEARGRLAFATKNLGTVKGAEILQAQLKQQINQATIPVVQSKIPKNTIAKTNFSSNAVELDKQIRALTSEYLKASKAATQLKKASKGLATTEVQIAEKAVERYKTALNGALKQAQAMNSATANMARGFAALNGSVASTTNVFDSTINALSKLGFSLFAIQQSVFLLQNAFRTVKRSLIDSNALLQQTQLAFAATFQNNFKESFGQSMERAGKFVAALREEAVKTNLTFEELQQSASTALPQLLSRGATEKQALKVISLVSQQAKFILGDKYEPGRVNDEIRALLNKQIVGRTNETIQSLGITREDLKKVKDMAGLLDLLDSKTIGLISANQEFQRTFLGAFDRASDSVFKLKAIIGKPLFDSLTKSLQNFNQAVADGKFDGLVKNLTAASGIIGTLIENVTRLGIELASLSDIKILPFFDFKVGETTLKLLAFAGGAAAGKKFGTIGAIIGGVGAVAGVDALTQADIDSNVKGATRGFFGNVPLDELQRNKKGLEARFKQLSQKLKEANTKVESSKNSFFKPFLKENLADKQKIIDEINNLTKSEYNLDKEIARRRTENYLPNPERRFKGSDLGTGAKSSSIRERARDVFNDPLRDITPTQTEINKFQDAIQQITGSTEALQAKLDDLNPGGLQQILVTTDELKQKQKITADAISTFTELLNTNYNKRNALETQFNALKSMSQSERLKPETQEKGRVLKQQISDAVAEEKLAKDQLQELQNQLDQINASLIRQSTQARHTTNQVNEDLTNLSQTLKEVSGSLELSSTNQALQQFAIISARAAAALSTVDTEIENLNNNLLATGVTLNSDGVAINSATNEIITDEITLAKTAALQRKTLERKNIVLNEAQDKSKALQSFVDTFVEAVNDKINAVQLQSGALTKPQIDAFTLAMNELIQKELGTIVNSAMGDKVEVTDANGIKTIVTITDDILRNAKRLTDGIKAQNRQIGESYAELIINPLENAFDALFDNILQGGVKFKEIFLGLFKEIVKNIQVFFSQQLFGFLKAKMIPFLNSGILKLPGVSVGNNLQATTLGPGILSAAGLSLQSIASTNNKGAIKTAFTEALTDPDVIQLRGATPKIITGTTSTSGIPNTGILNPNLLGGIAAIIGLGVAAKNIISGQGDKSGALLGGGIGATGGGVIGGLLAGAATGGIGIPMGALIGAGIGASAGSSAGLGVGKRGAILGGTGALLGGAAGFAIGGSSALASTAIGAKLGVFGGPVGAAVGAIIGGAIGVFTGNFFKKKGAEKIQKIFDSNQGSIDKAAGQALESTTLKELEKNRKVLEAQLKQSEAELNSTKGKGTKKPREDALRKLKTQRDELLKKTAELKKNLEKELKAITQDLKLQTEELKRPANIRGVEPQLRKSLEDLKNLLNKGVDRKLVFEFFNLQVEDIVRTMEEEVQSIQKQLTQGGENEKGELISLEQAMQLRIDEIRKNAEEELNSLRSSFSQEAASIINEGRAVAINPTVATRQERLAGLSAQQKKAETELGVNTTNSILREQNRTAREIVDLQMEGVKTQQGILFLLTQATKLAPSFLKGFPTTLLKDLETFANTYNPFSQFNIPAEAIGGLGVTINNLSLGFPITDTDLGRLIRQEIEKQANVTIFRRTAQNA